MNVGVPEVIIIAIVILVLFGSKKLPDAARSMGRSLRIFKSEVKEMSNDDKRFEEQQQQQAQIEAQPAQPVNPVVTDPTAVPANPQPVQQPNQNTQNQQ